MMKQGLFCYLLLALAAVGLVVAVDEAAAPVMEDVFEGKGTFGVQTAVCEGDGEFSGEAKFSGNGTISGDGTYSTQTGTFKGQGTYEGNQVVFTNKQALSGNLTIETIRVTEQSA